MTKLKSKTHRSDSLVAVRIDDLKQAVADGQSNIRSDIASMRASLDSVRTELPGIVSTQVSAQLNTFSTQHAAVHGIMDAEHLKDTQRFWAAVGVLSTILTIVVGLVSYKLFGTTGPGAAAAGLLSGGAAMIVLGAMKAKIAVTLVGLVGKVI
jgi:hypothetical protein